MSSSQTRAVPLIFTGVAVSLAKGGRTQSKDVWNSSLGGVFVGLEPPLPFGTEVDLEFRFAREVPSIVCNGYVVWSTTSTPERAPGKSGVGIRLVGLGIAQMRELAGAIGRDL